MRCEYSVRSFEVKCHRIPSVDLNMESHSQDDVEAAFAAWVSNGMPTRKGAKRKIAAGIPLTAPQRRDINSKVRDTVLQTLNVSIEATAKRELPKGTPSSKKQQWKKDTAVRFFETLSLPMQESLTPLAEAYTTGVLTQAAQAILQSDCPVEECKGETEASSSKQNAKDVVTQKPLLDLSRGRRSQKLKELTDQVLQLCASHGEAIHALRNVEARVREYFDQPEEGGETLPHEDESATLLAKVLQRFRDNISSSGDMSLVHSLDGDIRNTGLSRNHLRKLGFNIGKNAWARAGLDPEQRKLLRRGRKSKVANPAVIEKVVEQVRKNTQDEEWLYMRSIF